MDVVTLVPWRHTLSTIVIFVGLLTFWRGLLGERGLLRRGIGMLERLNGWRMLLVGLTLVGLGLAWFWDVRWLVVLSLGIGFVEIQEATHIIQAWRLGDVSKRTRQNAHHTRSLP